METPQVLSLCLILSELPSLQDEPCILAELPDGDGVIVYCCRAPGPGCGKKIWHAGRCHVDCSRMFRFPYKIEWVNTLFLMGTFLTTITAVPAYLWFYGIDGFQLGLFLFFVSLYFKLYTKIICLHHVLNN